MLFNSLEFFVFLPVVFILYWFVFPRSCRNQNVLLLLAGYFFYGWFNWRFVGLLLLSTIIDYAFGNWVAEGTDRKKRLFLWLSIANNLLILGFFKYYNFFALEVTHSFEAVGVHIHPYVLDIALPLGISFYTFHGMSYVIDIYRGNFKPAESFIDYAVFVCFFPLLVAGPIERAHHLLPQMTRERRFSYPQAVQGFRLIMWGFIKKVAIADNLAPTVDHVFRQYHLFGGSTLILATVYFAFQVYGDFSGYTDIAIGVAKLFGFELFSNFRFPYASKSTSEFWRRWHISLSSWFSDYVFNPVVIALRGWGRVSVLIALFITFFLSGLWHGAGWHFVVYGLIYFVALSYEFYTRKFRKALFKPLPLWLNNSISTGITFTFITFAFIFFRSPTLIDSIGFLKAVPHRLFTLPQYREPLLIYVLPFLLVDWHFRNDERNLQFPQNRMMRYAVYCLMFFVIIYYSGNNASFFYFQF